MNNIASVALITGAARGIGRAIALELARPGLTIYLNDVALGDEAERTQKDVEAKGLVPQYFTPGTFTAIITLTTTQPSPEYLAAVNPNGVNHHEQEPTDHLWNGGLDVASICANRICADHGDHNG